MRSGFSNATVDASNLDLNTPPSIRGVKSVWSEQAKDDSVYEELRWMLYVGKHRENRAVERSRGGAQRRAGKSERALAQCASYLPTHPR